MPSIWKFARQISRKSEGASLVETALLLPIMLLLAAGAVDFGRAYWTAIEIESAAHAGALYGIQNPTDTSGMVTAANLGADGLPALQSTAAYGCECSDGSSPVADCSFIPLCDYNYVNYVSVTSTATFVPLMRYPGIPNSFTLSSTSRMRSGGD